MDTTQNKTALAGAAGTTRQNCSKTSVSIIEQAGNATGSAINEDASDKASCTPRSCPKFESCSAPICPFDRHWQKRKHLCEDRVCFYLLEYSKVNARAVFDVAGCAHLYQDIGRVAQAICAAHPNINWSYIRASNSGSRMDRRVPTKKIKTGGEKC